jgi:hypothetical protein
VRAGREGRLRRPQEGALSGAAAVVVVFALLSVCGAGVVALLGLARTARELLANWAIVPLAGAAWAGIAGATLGTVGSRLGVIGLVILTLATCAAGGVRVARARTPGSQELRRSVGLLELALAGGGLLLVVALSALAVYDSRDKPLAEYDGWAMWGMKARALASLDGADAAVFASDAYARLHLEYPLLLPSLNGLPLELASGYSSHTVVLSCLALGLAGLFALFGIWRGRVRTAVLLPCLAALAAIPAFFLQLQTGYADVPVAVFVATGLAASARWLADPEDSWLALATLFLAAAVLTKNEGLLFALAVLLPLWALAAGRRAKVALAGFVALLAYAPWRAYTAVHDLGSPDYDLSKSLDVDFVADRLDRAPTAARELLETALDPDRFGLALVFGATVTVVALALGRRRIAGLTAAFAALSLAGLTWVYVLTPHELGFFLSTNADRVVVAPLLGLMALAPLLIEDTARALEAEAPVRGPR